MSFAATLALIAAYAYGQPLARAGANSPLATRAALWGVKEIVSLLLASLIAGLATTPYAAYHFHRVAPHGVIANLLAMPVVSACMGAARRTPCCQDCKRGRRAQCSGGSTGFDARRDAALGGFAGGRLD